MSDFQKVQNRKIQGQKKTPTLCPLEVIPPEEGDACNNGLSLFFVGTPIRSHDQRTDPAIRRTVSFWPTLAPTSHVQATSGMCAQLPALGLGLGAG